MLTADQTRAATVARGPAADAGSPDPAAALVVPAAALVVPVPTATRAADPAASPGPDPSLAVRNASPNRKTMRRMM